MSKKVIVYNISATASEKTVKDFFLFCGKIKEFELIKEESSDKQIAYITFERETAAKTALMLTNAVIGDSQITVKCADDNSTDECDGTQDGDGLRQEDKPMTGVVAELLAAGYQIQDSIIEKAIEFDAKFGISARFSNYLKTIQEQLQSLENKYHVYETVSNKATEFDAKYDVQTKVRSAASQVQDKANQALDTTTGKQFLAFYSTTSKQVADVHNEARRIANEKKAAQIVGASNQPNQEKVETQ